jgi:ATP-dependent helicase HrpA
MTPTPAAGQPNAAPPTPQRGGEQRGRRRGRRAPRPDREQQPDRQQREQRPGRARQLAEQRAARRAALPPITYPPELPVSQLKDDIAAAIRDHQVVVIAGETGSGKTTQIPKICLELGRGVTGQIGHTQPRRLAARTVAERIAEELRTPLGEAVGYKVRFTDKSADDTLIKLMTDGILLTELARDRQLRQYDTIIIDEAHERSLNIDFILGCLRQLLPKRPDLKVIITSATIDPERFSQAFNGAPIIEVSGRTYPVEVRYRPAEEDTDQTQAISDAVSELEREAPGDILVFLSGEREIRDTADALSGRPRLEILPLYSRLSAAEQHKVFEPRPSSFTRRVVLATNVAETSLTVPGIRYVVDPGTARISRYSRGTKVQRLPIEPISQASANQRKGRCGRLADGICIRLYSEADFASRPPFTDPEILRTNLASVILQMAAIDLGDIPAFPFIDPPDARNIADGLALLAELDAFKNGQITRLGRRLARLPVDPRIGRMILEADRNGCAREVLIIAAALSIQDPRERPVEAQEAADAAHRRFANPDSDFVAFLNLWEYLRERQGELSSSAFRRLCRNEFLGYLRVREWQDLHGQLRRLAEEVGVKTESSSQDPTVLHVSLLAGLLSQIGMKIEVAHGRPGQARTGRRPRAEYLGARGARFAIFPGSVLARKPPDWLVAAELVETSALFARTAAKIEPEWVEPLAQHLVKRTYSEPHWSKKRGSAVALEKITLYGVPLVADRAVSYGRIDPVTSRELFIRHALVDGEWDTSHRFFHENRRLLAEVAELEDRVRRRGLVAGEDELYALYDARIPADVVSAQHFDTWWKQARRTDPGLLTFTVGDLLADDAADVDAGSYPDVWTSQTPGVGALPLNYEFAPGTAADGVTVDVPLSRLNQMDPDEFSWQVPGLRAELVTELIRSLPKALRRDLVPAPDVAREVLARLGTPHGDVRDVLSRELRQLRGVDIPRSDWDLTKLPPHLRITFRVTSDGGTGDGGTGDGGTVLATGDDLAALQRQLRPKLRAKLSAAAGDIVRSGLTTWDFDELPAVFKDGTIVAYPALVDAGDTVGVRLFETESAARTAMWAGTRRLILLGLPSPVKSIAGGLTTRAKLALSHNPHGSVAAMFADCVNCAADFLIAQAGGPVRDRAGFERLRTAVRGSLPEMTADVVGKVEIVLGLAHELTVRLDETRAAAVRGAVEDMREQLGGLIYPGFVTATGYRKLNDLARYLRGMERRLSKLPESPARDALNMAVVQRVEQTWRQAVAGLPPARRNDEDVRAIRWMVQELRVSLFAQGLGTPAPVSETRIMAAIRRLTG